ncbi:hypothetical protein PoB_003412300 [Plakobranchus ocellatus]|uniref:Uncharacterized protein n=1 Tax=Plakobranchus ocellatus TaxID=259542 RepID=A0AAV4AM28_9GAST|nr:hypothetical protein PoB_003412300 [Plakobranchus ocellatus]
MGQILTYYEVIPGFKALLKSARSCQAVTYERKVFADITASSLAIEPPRNYIVRNQNRIEMTFKIINLVQFCDHDTPLSPYLCS